MSNQSKFNEIAKVIQTKNGTADTFTGNQFIDKIRNIDRLTPMTTIISGYDDNGYYGYEVCKVAKSYLQTRYRTENRIRWNYNDTCIFDKNNTAYALRGTPKRFKSDGVTESAQWLDHVQNSRAGLNMIDCSTFVGLCLRGIDYEHSPYALISSSTWSPANRTNGIRKLTSNSDYVWKQTFLDYQPDGTGSNIGYTGNSTIRTAASLAELYFKIGQIIYDKKTDGTLTAILSGTKTVGFKADDGIDMFHKFLPGDLIFWSSASASAAQKARFRSISHVGISSENPRYYYEATTMLETLYYRDLLPTSGNPAGKFGEISLIIRPDYRPRTTQTYETPINVNLLEFPWTFSRISTIEKFNTLKRNNPDISDSDLMAELLSSLNSSHSSRGLWWNMINKNTIGIWGKNTNTVYASLAGSTEYAYNSLKLSPGTYELSLEHNGSAVSGNNIDSVGFALQVKKAGSTDDLLTLSTGGTDTILNSVQTASLGSYEVDDETGEVHIGTSSTASTTTKTIRAFNNQVATFIVENEVEVCIRLYVGTNSGNGYVFGNYSAGFNHLTETKNYLQAQVSLKRIS